MLLASKYRIYPTKDQEILIGKTIGCARKVYNLLLEFNKEHYKETKESKFPEVTFFKNQEEFAYLNEVDSLALANAKLHIQTAFKSFLHSIKKARKGKRIGFPKKKSKKISRLAYSTNNVNNSIRIEEINGKAFIKIPKIGFVEIVLHRPLGGDIRSATVVKNNENNYEISVLTEKEITNQNKEYDLNNLKVLGIDMSFHNLAVLSTGEKTNHPKWYRRSEELLGRRQRKMSLKTFGSKNRDKARADLKRLSLHVANQRKDFLHKLSRRLITEFDVIVLEDINMQTMGRRRNQGKSVGDMGFGMFRTFLEYKSEIFDKFVYKVDRFFPSSQLCSHCGYQNPLLKDVKIVKWDCPVCAAHHDRDINAANNLKQNFENNLRKNTEGTSGIYACGDESSTLSSMIGQVLSMNQEAPALTRG